ncbi:MAG: PIN domain nuclease [Acidobacteria bacterium]|nr:PIN domain nuclease [Acidobacteriota bacterium]
MGATGPSAPVTGLPLDAGALIAIERGDRRMIALLQEALRKRLRLRVPAGVIGQAWRDGRRQTTLTRFFKTREVEVHTLDAQLARAAGELCGVAGTKDVIDATVVLAARPTADVVVTGDPDDILKLDPTIRVERI